MRRVSSLLAVLLCFGALSLPGPVAGTSMPRAAGQLSCPGSDGSVKVLSRHVVDEPAGTVGVYLDVRNRTRAWRGQLRGHLCFYDAQGHLVDTGLWFSDQIAIGPKQRISTYMSEDPPSSWDRVKVTFRSKKTKLRAVSHHVKVKVGKVRMVDGHLQVPVKVRNKNRFAIRHVAVYVSLFDDRDRIISMDLSVGNYTDPRRIKPGKVGRYVADAFADADGLHHVRVQVEAFRKR
jgi:hypothetical protein